MRIPRGRWETESLPLVGSIASPLSGTNQHIAGRWGERRGSNPRPQEPQSCALPTELRPPLSAISYVVCLSALNVTDNPSSFYYAGSMTQPLCGLGLRPVALLRNVLRTQRVLVANEVSSGLPLLPSRPIYNGLERDRCKLARLAGLIRRRSFVCSPPARCIKVARLAGLEPATLGLEGRCSIHMSYRRFDPFDPTVATCRTLLSRSGPKPDRLQIMVGAEGFEPPTPLLPKQVRYQAALCPEKSASEIGRCGRWR